MVKQSPVLKRQAIQERAIAAVGITNEGEGLSPKEKGVDLSMQPRDIGICGMNTTVQLGATGPLAIGTENDCLFWQTTFANDQ